MLHDPDILILDEPTSGLDPIQIREVRALIRELGDRHTILLSTHIMSEVEAVCGRVVMVVGGRIALDQPLDRLQARNVVLVEARGPAVAIGHALKGVAGVAGVESSPLGTDWHRFEVTVAGEADLREPLAQRVVAGGWGLRLLDLGRSSLEDRFVRAVQEASLRRAGDAGDAEVLGSLRQTRPRRGRLNHASRPPPGPPRAGDLLPRADGVPDPPGVPGDRLAELLGPRRRPGAERAVVLRGSATR